MDCSDFRMTNAIAIDSLDREFKKQGVYLIAGAGFLIATPFTINNLLQERYLIALFSTLVVVSFALAAWTLRGEREQHPALPLIIVALIFLFLSLSIAKQGMTGILWCFPSILAFYCLLEERQAWVSNGLLLLLALPASFFVVEPALATRVCATLSAVSLFTAISARTTSIYQASLKKRIVTDPLTGLLNRSLLKFILGRAVDQATRVGTPMALIAIDLDHFKEVNDTFGHSTGDEVLTQLGQIVRENTRLADSSFRLGGEEFLCLLYGSDRHNAMLVAYKMLNALSNTEIIEGHPVTASFGVSELEPNMSWEDWANSADKRLYAAKNAGRNCVR